MLAMLTSIVGCQRPAALAAHDPCNDPLVTLESGRVVAVDWVDRRGSTVHSRSEITQSLVIDSTIELRDDETVSRARSTVTSAGDGPRPTVERAFGAGSIYWGEMMASSIEQAIARARHLDTPTARFIAGSLFSDATSEVSLERLAATSWTVDYHGKRYAVRTAPSGCLVEAKLERYGVAIERRATIDYPLWPPYAAPPDGAYVAEEVAIPAPPGHTLAGTLTHPRTSAPTAIVLITGLSPHERNDGDPPWMPFRDLADALTRAGFTVLRVDDRGVGKSTGDHAPSTTFDEADDVRTEIAWMRAHAGIERVVLVGHSEGGLIAMMVAAGDPAIAGVVTLAAPGVSGPEVARFQTEAAVARDPSIAPPAREAEIARLLAEPLTPREQSFMAIDPISFANRVRCPTLIVQGGADLTIPPKSASAIASAMSAHGNRDVTVRMVPEVGHELLPDPDALGPSMLPAFLTLPAITDAIVQWVRAR